MTERQLRALTVPGMSTAPTPPASSLVDRWALRRIQEGLGTARVRCALWDGYAVAPADTPPIATIVIRTRMALWRWLQDPDLNFGEAYMQGAVAVAGELEAVLEETYRATAWKPARGRWWRGRNTLRAAQANVHHHYDLGNAFYQLWLDPQLLYSCAFFPHPGATLADAQVAKMDRICRKLRLRAGERVIEAGCGWGALALFMASRYGVTVDAFNLSAEQVAYARRRATDEGLAGRVRFVQDDYRHVTGRYDVFVSVGMLEHVGLDDFSVFGRVIDGALGPDGRGLLHFIGRNSPAPLNAWIQRRIFPGAYPPTLREVCERVLEPQALSVLDVENLRLHYALTLDRWRQAFEQSADAVGRMFDEPFVRAWRLYLAGSQAAFTTGWMQLFQIAFARGTTNAIPWTRDGGDGPPGRNGQL